MYEMNTQEIINKLIDNNGRIFDDHFPSHFREYQKECDGYVILTREGVDYVCPLFDLEKPEHSWNTQGFSLNPLYEGEDGQVHFGPGCMATYFRGKGIVSLFPIKEVVWFDQAA